MRTKRGLGTGLYGALLLWLAGGSLGCSQLWRPFLQDVEAPPDCSQVGESGCPCRRPATSDGKEWSYLDVGTSADLYGGWVAPGSKRPWLVGDNGLLMRRRL